MKYDVALSFAGEDREYVEAVATELKKLGVRVFYDNFETVSLWGKDLYTYLQKIYEKDSEYVIFFISKHYAEKLWTNHERKMAQARAFREKREYILPARFDDTEIEGITSTTAFIDLRKHTPEGFAKITHWKINEQTEKPQFVSLPVYTENIINNTFELSKIDNLILKLSCEMANDKGSEYIFHDDLSIIQQKADINEDEFYESLEILNARKCIRADRRVGSKNMRSFKITLSGYKHYAEAYMEVYPLVIRLVTTEIVQSNARYSRAISEAIEQPLMLVNHIFERLESENLIQISKMVGSGDGSNLRISSTSPELKRRLS